MPRISPWPGQNNMSRPSIFQPDNFKAGHGEFCFNSPTRHACEGRHSASSCRCPAHLHAHIKSGLGGMVHQCIKTELADAALEQVVEAELGEANNHPLNDLDSPGISNRDRLMFACASY